MAFVAADAEQCDETSKMETGIQGHTNLRTNAILILVILHNETPLII